MNVCVRDVRSVLLLPVCYNYTQKRHFLGCHFKNEKSGTSPHKAMAMKASLLPSQKEITSRKKWHMMTMTMTMTMGMDARITFLKKK